MNAREAARPWYRRARFWALPAVALHLALALAWLPSTLLESAEQRLKQCVDDAAAGTDQPPPSCRPGWRLWWPGVVPWTRERAQELSATTVRQMALVSLDRATVVRPTAAARDRAARMVAAAMGQTIETQRELADAGAFEAAADVGPQGSWPWVQAKVALGRLDELRSAKIHDAKSRPWSEERRLGAWLCLVGRHREGRRLLLRADAEWRARSWTLTGNPPARQALVACGGPAARRQFGVHEVASYMRRPLRLVQLQDPAWRKGRRRAVIEELLEATRRSRDETRLQVLAMAADSFGWGARALLEAAWPAGDRPLMLEGRFFISPWTLLGPHRFGIAADPGLLARGAARYGGAADDLPSGMQSSPCSERLPRRIREAPASGLRHIAWLMDLRAAAAHVRLGQLDAARRAVARADAQGPSDLRWLAAATELAAGDIEAAIQRLRRASSSAALAAPQRVAAQLGLALGLAAAGRFKEAHRQARQGYVNSQKLGVASPLGLTAAELYAALAHRSGQREAALRALPAVKQTDAPLERRHQPAALLAWAGSSAPGRRRKATRWFASPPVEVLPARVYLLGTLCGEGCDVEVWLDRALARFHLQGDVRYPLARAEAARWRGDETAAKRWGERARRLRARLTGARALVLYQLAVKP